MLLRKMSLSNLFLAFERSFSRNARAPKIHMNLGRHVILSVKTSPGVLYVLEKNMLGRPFFGIRACIFQKCAHAKNSYESWMPRQDVSQNEPGGVVCS